MGNGWPKYLAWRDGRPRWIPGPGLRKAGFKSRDLKDGAGAWLSKGAAVAAADDLNKEVVAWRTAGAGPRRPKRVQRQARSFRELYTNWTATPEFKLLGAKTRRGYVSNAEIFLTTPIENVTIGDLRVAAFTRANLRKLWRKYFDERGHAMANAILTVVRIMFSFAVDEDWITVNPAKGMKMKGTAPRLVLIMPEELAAFVDAAEELGLPSIADAIITGLHTGQRLSDVLSMPEQIFDDKRVRLSQLKTKARIDAPMTPALQARCAAIKARRAGRTVVDLAAPLVLTEAGARYNVKTFNTKFRQVRDLASKRAAGCADKQFLDLRDTAVTRLAMAECTMPEIAAITGHTLESITKIIKHYLVLQPSMADAAIGKLNAWMEREGLAI